MGKNSKIKSKQTRNSNSILKTLTSELFQKCVNPTDNSTPSPKERFNAYKEIHEMIKNIEDKKGLSAVSQMKNREDCIPEFIEWAKQQNISFESVELKSTRDAGLGIFAAKNLCEAEMFIKVPKGSMMTSETVASSPIGRIVAEDPMLSSMPNVALALLLVYELLNEKSKWQPYINILPRSYSNILYFDIADVELLKGTSVYLEALNVLRSIARQYAYINNLLLKHPLGKSLGLADRITYADYKWAVATLMTRQNSIPSTNGFPPDIALIPFLDLCNHSEGVASIDFNQEEKSCECFAPSSIEKGNEVFISYGVRPNTELVIYNGFFYPENIHDCIKLKLGISKTDPEFEIRRDLLRKHGLEESFQLGCLPTPLRDPLNFFLSVANASLSELEKMKTLDKSELEAEARTDIIIGKETSAKRLKFLKDRCTLLLKLLPVMSLPDDEASDVAIQRPTAKLSAALRNNERRILKEAILYAEDQLKSFQE